MRGTYKVLSKAVKYLTVYSKQPTLLRKSSLLPSKAQHDFLSLILRIKAITRARIKTTKQNRSHRKQGFF